MIEQLQPGDPQQAGPFKLEGRLSTGGAGNVYLAHGRVQGKVALKIARRELANGPEFRQQLVQEALAASRVRSRRAIRLIDADARGGLAWVATVYVDAPSLAEVIERQGPMPERALAELADGLAEGLADIHAAGLVHQSLTPRKVLLGPHGSLITGFGMPRPAEDISSSTIGLPVGTAGFISPEQVLGHEASPASDVYSLGAVLAYAATGREPFGREAPQEIFRRTITELPDLRGAPGTMAALIERCMAKNPKDRPSLGFLMGQLPGSGPPTKGSAPYSVGRDTTRRSPAPPAAPQSAESPAEPETRAYSPGSSLNAPLNIPDEDSQGARRRRQSPPAAHSAPAAAEPWPSSRAKGTAWPHLQAPPAVVVGRPFQIEVGLGERRDPAVYGTGKLTVPTGNFTLGVELIVDGFTVKGHRAFTLDVTTEDRYPKRTVTLVASTNPQFAARRRIGVVFRVGRGMRGYAARDVDVTIPGAVRSAVPAAAAEPVFGGFDVSPFQAGQAADLTIVIQQGDASHGSRFVWSVASPHLEISLPPDGTGQALLAPAERFLSELVAEASGTTDALDLFASLTGRGKADIAPLMPRFVKDALRSVAQVVAPRRPTVLLLTQDPYVPWELAVLDPPLPGWEPGGSPFLGAQAVIGRWVLAAEPPPAPDPPRSVQVRDQVVVTGDYEGVLEWSELKSARHEAGALRARWPAARAVEASLPAVLACLSGSPEADIIHFALHGQFSTDDARQGLVLIGADEAGKYPVYLKPSHVDAGKLSRSPLVFLNACQVGASRAVLGNYSGMASAFVRAGAAAVIAPLWSVDDEAASAIALEFYRQALDASRGPAEVLRACRAGVTSAAIAAGSRAASGTHIAYQFFGHPNLRLSEAPGTPEGRP